MDAIALAQSLDDLKIADGVISLRALQMQLRRRGLDELACAVRSLAGRVTSGKLNVEEIVPWF